MHRILIIDDEVDIQKMLKKFLKMNGYDVIAAGNGKEGMKLFHTYNPDLIITDLIMPDKEGLETIRELKQQNPDVKIVAISGGGHSDPRMYLNFAEKFGALKTFEKPLNNEKLLLAIEDILA